MGKATRRTTRTSARSRQAKRRKPANAFKGFAMHVTEPTGKKMFETLRGERSGLASFSLAPPEKLDPETAAKRVLEHALASKSVPSFVPPKVDDAVSEFKSLGVNTVPLTGTKVVKFRQTVRGIPVYG